MRYYAGIGSRQTPTEILKLFTKIGIYLAKKDYILRSGHADGADLAFEQGCDIVNGQKEIYLPWENFNNSTSNLVVVDLKAFEIAKQFHPYWHNLKQGARKLQARNSYQVLGKDLNTNSDFVICWTKNGELKGGTSQALRIAMHYNIPIFNFGLYTDNLELGKEEFRKFIKQFI